MRFNEAIKHGCSAKAYPVDVVLLGARLLDEEVFKGIRVTKPVEPVSVESLGAVQSTSTYLGMP